jgi:hypothetical protein
MVGTFADVVIADAIVKDVPGFDLRMAIDALSKDVRTELTPYSYPISPSLSYSVL